MKHITTIYVVLSCDYAFIKDIWIKMLEYEKTKEHITQDWRNMESLVHTCINSQKEEISLLQSARSNLFLVFWKYFYTKGHQPQAVGILVIPR